MSSDATRKLSVGNRSMETYVFLFNNYLSQGVRRVVLYGRGENIARAVDLYNLISHRLGNLVRLCRVNIGTEVLEGRHASYIELELEVLR